MNSQLNCRFCGAALSHTFVDLGMSPLCESYVSAQHYNEMEPFYPLHVYVCSSCYLVQLGEYVTPEQIFSEYAYFSSYADSWVAHAKSYTEMVIKRYGLDERSLVVEVASNDGYLLQHFLPFGIPVLGIEPAANVAAAAIRKGIPTEIMFLGQTVAQQLINAHGPADLIVANNVLAQVPELNDFVKGIKTLLKPNGIVTLEFPHLVRLMQGTQFDTIYHEHYSYFSGIAVDKILTANGLKWFDVDELLTHGGSLRVYACHQENDHQNRDARVDRLLAQERADGLMDLESYSRFGEKVKETKRKLLEFLIKAKRDGNTVVGYGAPGKGNTLLNYCGIKTDFVDFTVDRNPYKQGKFLPGSRIPIHHPDVIKQTKPDFLLILPWNFRDEIMNQQAYIRDWGGRFVVPIPSVQVLP